MRAELCWRTCDEYCYGGSLCFFENNILISEKAMHEARKVTGAQSILIKYKTVVTPKINILIACSFRLSFSHHQE